MWILEAPKELSDIRRFFLEPHTPKQRQYEALRAYFVEGLPSQEVARSFRLLGVRFSRPVPPLPSRSRSRVLRHPTAGTAIAAEEVGRPGPDRPTAQAQLLRLRDQRAP